MVIPAFWVVASFMTCILPPGMPSPQLKGILLHLKEHNLTSFALSLSLFHAILSEPAKIGWNL
jgi:hypothetical protein